MQPRDNFNSELTTECRDALLNALAKHLNTLDKRYMFIFLLFNKDIRPSAIQLEGTSDDTAWNIYDEFKKQCMLGSLIAAMNLSYDLELTLELKK